MGHRTVKRVALEFEWPLHKVWTGYLNPYPGGFRCRACDGSGYSPEAKRLQETFYGHDGWGANITQEEVAALVEHGRLFDFTHTWSRETGWVRRADDYVPTAAEVNAWQRKGGLGHDGINSGILIEERCKRMGVSHLCAVCHGNGDVPNPDERIRKLSEEWEDFEPPPGSGWQLWETTSEGSPISPVCASAEELARWCATNASIFANERLRYEEWLAMFRTGSDAVETGSMVVGVMGGPIGSIAGQAAQHPAAQELIRDAAAAEEEVLYPELEAATRPGPGR